MGKIRDFIYQIFQNYLTLKKIVLVISVFIFITFTSLLLSIPSRKNNEIRSKAAETSKLFPLADISSIQQSIDAASDGQTVVIPAGTYSGGTAIPLASNRPFANRDRGASDTCFLRVENKNITLVGRGATLFGEGHDKPYQDPYQMRAGLCILNSTVYIDGLRVKEFQKRCVVAVDSHIVYKNGVVDGCDEGGISLLGDSTAVVLNNLIIGHNFGGVMLWQNSQAKIINNIFYNAIVLFFYHSTNNDRAYAEITNNIFNSGEDAVSQVIWWGGNAHKLKTNKLSHNLYQEKKACDPVFNFCDDFPGKMFGDPLYIEPVVDPRGMAAWANFGLKEGSPAIRAGNDGNNLGVEGGVCANGESPACQDFIAQESAKLVPPAPPTSAVPTSEPYSPPPVDNIPSQPARPPPGDNGPPITYYLPPTVAYDRQPEDYLPPATDNQQPITPSPKPTSPPIIDIEKTKEAINKSVETAKSAWQNFLTSIIQFTKTILP